MEQATKDEVQKLLAQLPQPPKSRFSALFVKIGLCYTAVALLTTAALLFSVFELYLVSSTARQIAGTDLPVLTAITRMRSSLLAQEGFAGQYAIFRDAAFIDLFRQRQADSMADLALLERTNSIAGIGGLKRLYLDYHTATESLFIGNSRNRKNINASAVRLLNALDTLYIQRQGMLQTVLERAQQQQKRTIRWIIAISGAGCLLAIIIAPFIVYRITRALGKLQKETHRIASGDFNYHPQVPEVPEISDLTKDFNDMAARIKDMERKNLEAVPHTRLPGNQAIERVVNERLNSGAPFSFCHLQLNDFQQFLARYGYGMAGELLHETGVLVYSAVTGYGAPGDFAGHAGGDNFVMVLSTERVAAVCDAVVKDFDRRIRTQLTTDGGGEGSTAPNTTVSIAVVDCSADKYRSAAEVAGAAVNARHSLYNRDGSSCGQDRLTGGQGELI
jgi:GGDEF domain-containing protein